MSAADRAEHLDGFAIVTQHDRLGTGHATGIALPVLPPGTDEVLVLCGDVPCLRAETLRALVAKQRAAKSAAAVLTMVLDDPFGYGRIVRHGDGGPVEAIVEERDAAPDVKAIREVNSGTYIFRRDLLEDGIKALKPDNAQGEYYLTDVVRYAVEKGETVVGVVADDPRELLGVNTPVQLAEVGEVLAARPGLG
jgi:bifunctional UDP-N-acetylglucosamine pyrophosphorylase/glucosamine-1-phosphate N-acetyltransferase